jgi:hypothetical protein
VGVENDGKGARLAAHRADERRWRCGQFLGEGRRSEGGGPVARGRGEGGDCGCGIGAENKTRHGGEKSGRRQRQHPCKGGRWGHSGGGGVGGGRVTHRGAQGGGSGSHRRGIAQAARPAAAQPRHACPHSGGRCRVADERGPDGSGRAWGERHGACVGRPGKEMEWAEPV